MLFEAYTQYIIILFQTPCGGKKEQTISLTRVITNHAQNSMQLLQGQAKYSAYSKPQPEVCREVQCQEDGKHLCPAEASPQPK